MPLPKPTMSVWAKIAPMVTKMKSFRGGFTTRQEELELTHDDVAVLRHNIINKPLRYNHDDDTLIGVVGADRVNADQSWDVRLDMSDQTIEGRACIEHMRSGHLTGVSLQHDPNTLEPLEVSLCVKGARGDAARIISYDSNTKLYTLPRERGSNYNTISASDAPVIRHTLTLCKASFSIEPIVMSAAAPPIAALPSGIGSPSGEPLVSDALATHGASVSDADASAPDAAESDVAMASGLVVTGECEKLLGGAHTIPSRQSREAVLGKVADVEMKAADLETKLAAAEAELDALRKSTHVAPPVLASAALSAEEFNQRVMNDVVATFSNNESEKRKMQGVMGTLTPDQINAVAQISGFIQSGCAHPVQASEAAEPRDAKAELEFSMRQKRMSEWRKSKQQQQQQPKAPVAASAGGSSYEARTDYNFSSRSAPMTRQAPVRASAAPMDHAQYVVGAEHTVSASRSNEPFISFAGRFGMPLRRKPLYAAIAASRGITSSETMFQARENEMQLPEFQPGCGANFVHTMCATHAQRDVFLNYGKRTNAEIGTSIIMSQQLSPEALAMRKMYQHGVQGRTRAPIVMYSNTSGSVLN